MNRLKTSKTGQALLLFSLSSIVLFGVLGLVVDIGWAYYRKQVAQSAAESAAIAAVAAAVKSSPGDVFTCGAQNVVCQSPTRCPTPAHNALISDTDIGCAYAATNGFSATGRQNVTMEANTTVPSNVGGVTPKYWVTVRVSESIPQLFSSVLGVVNASITARSTAGYFPASIGGCIYVLNPTSQAMQMNGNIQFTTGCGINIDSTSPSALNLVGGAKLTAVNNSKIKIVGGYAVGTNATVTPTPVTGATPFKDPLGDVPPPPIGSCTSFGVTPRNNENVTIDPGVYCGAISVTGHAILNLNPGLYIITTGGLSVGGQATLYGTGVTIYLKTSSVSLAGGATTNVSGPTRGPWQGVLFYQDRSDTTSASLVGGSAQILNGVLYFPTTHMDYTGGNNTTSQSVTIVADTLNITGNSWVNASGTSPFLTLFSGIGVFE
jgi:Flp pilus assembly protein TadG